MTLLGTAGQIALGVFDLDLLCDIRDLSADAGKLLNGEAVSRLTIVLDVVALIPVIGAVKYLKNADVLVKGAEAASDVGKIGKKADEIADVGKIIGENADKIGAIGKGICKDADVAVEEGAKSVDEVAEGSRETISYTDYDNIYQSSIQNAGKDKIMLGKYDGGGASSYITKAGKEYEYFDLGKNWDAIKAKHGYTDDDMFKLFNEAFLDDGINAGKTFQFSHNPVGDRGALGIEFEYLLKNNYIWDEKAMTLMPKY